MTPDEEYEFYARYVNQIPRGPARRLAGPRATDAIRVRFPPQVLEEIRRRATTDGHTVAAWIKQLVEQEIRRPDLVADARDDDAGAMVPPVWEQRNRA